MLALRPRPPALLRLRNAVVLSSRIRYYGVVADAPIPRKTKVWDSVEEAVKDVKSGDTILSGGFGLCGVPETLIKALTKREDVKNITAISNNAGARDLGLVRLVKSGQLETLRISYLGGNKLLESMYLKGEIGIELIPQGTLVARLNAHAAGFPAIYTPTGANTAVETGGIPIRYNPGGMDFGVLTPGHKKDAKEFNGRRYVLEPAIAGDVAFVHAWKADEVGNLVFRYTANNYNGVMARNAKLTIVEAEHIVPAGSLSPNAIHVPGIYVDRIVRANEPKNIEVLALAQPKKESADSGSSSAKASTDWRHRIAKRAAKEIHDGFYVNLGVGIPTLVPEHLDPDVKVWMESENGILGMGPYPTEEQVDPDIINAGKETSSLLPGSSTFDSIESFNMIRGGHVDVTVLGAMQVSQAGDIANFMIPGKLVKGIGGAMDLVSNPDKTKVIVTMQHCSKDGTPKIVAECSLPLTGARSVSMIVTDMAVFNVDRAAGCLELVDIAEGVTLEELRAKTACDFKVPETVGRM
ncbi:3-oxoacid CoA-transferase [Amylocystis lapponica]|nr:3-oxoacid CoA-transferase [Amylocystis lapponica]